MAEKHTWKDGSITGTFSRDEILAIADSILTRRYRRGFVVTDPNMLRPYLRKMLGTRMDEHLAVVFLDTHHRLIAYKEMFSGTINGASVHARPIVRTALELNAAAVVLAHNHPSNQCNPSANDRAITSRVRDALNLFDVRLLDHFVVTSGDITSFALRGLL